jgi:hypothetical protein
MIPTDEVNQWQKPTERLKASGRPIAKLPKKTKQRRKKTG